MKPTSRGVVASVLLGTVASGLLLRFQLPLPDSIRDAAGGIAYVIAAALGVLLLKPNLQPAAAAASGFVLTCAVEFLQLWQPAWLQAIRATSIGRAVLGTTFSWSDFAPYAAGAILAWLLITFLRSDTT